MMSCHLCVVTRIGFEYSFGFDAFDAPLSVP